MVLYLDLVFALNAVSDLLALYVTARLSGRGFRWRRLILVSLCGGVYGVLSGFPSAYLLRNFAVQIVVAACMVWFAFRTRDTFLRLFLLFFLLSCAIGGAFMAFAQFASEEAGKLLEKLNWKAFSLVGAFSWIMLSVVFRGSAHHIVSGQIYSVSIMRDGRVVHLNALLDTGHTLKDPVSDAPVMTVWCDALCDLWFEEEREILAQLKYTGSLSCIEELAAVAPGKFNLIPYSAVGISVGYLLCFKPDKVMIDGACAGALKVALSPTPVSNGSGYAALWSGERGVLV